MFQIQDKPQTGIGNELIVEVAEKHKTDHKIYHLDLPGIYQTKNLLTVLETCYQLQNKGWIIPAQTITDALKQTKKITGLHGRWEVIHHHPLIILDVAHNVDGIKQLVRQIELTEHHHLHIILGMVKDKEAEKPNKCDGKYYVCHYPKRSS